MHANMHGAPLRPTEPGSAAGRARRWSAVYARGATALLGLSALALIIAGHVALNLGWLDWQAAAPLSIRAFAAATAVGIGIIELAAYRGRRRPASLIVGATFLGVGLIKSYRVAISLIGQHLDAPELYTVSIKLGWAQGVFLPVVLILGMILISPNPQPSGVRATPRITFVVATIALGVSAALGALLPGFPGDVTALGVVSRPDAGWAVAAHLFLLAMLWRRPDMSATPSGRWLTFAMFVSLLNQLLVAPFWTIGAPAAASSLNAMLYLVTFVIVGSGVAVGMVALARSEAAASARAHAHEIEEKRIKGALALQAARLQHANDELAQYAYLASHDLQEPLRMITSYLQLVERRYRDVLDDEGREFMQFAVDGALRMKRLTNDLLLYSRVSARPVEHATTDANEAFDAACRNLAIAISETGATVTRDDLPTIPMAPVEVAQLLQNLIGNALKFRREGVAPVVHASAARDGDAWRFSLSDNGIGIDERHQERVFGVFQRLHSGEAFAGSGIGLALCRKIVERHGGRIWFVSSPGRGTTFEWTVPTSIAAAPADEGPDIDPELEEQVTTLIERARDLT